MAEKRRTLFSKYIWFYVKVMILRFVAVINQFQLVRLSLKHRQSKLRSYKPRVPAVWNSVKAQWKKKLIIFGSNQFVLSRLKSCLPYTGRFLLQSALEYILKGRIFWKNLIEKTFMTFKNKVKYTNCRLKRRVYGRYS